jgi:hypothetical protein
MATQVTLNSGSVDSAGSLALKTNGTTTAVTINASQGVEFNAGAVGTPSITTTGDTNTGIFFPAADTIAFAEGGVEAARFDSSGNLGVGTASPTGRLDVATASTNDDGIYLTADGTSFGYASNITFRSKLTSGGSIGVAAKIRAELSSSNNTGLLFFTTAAGTNAEKMRLDASGNLGVGATSPAHKIEASSSTNNYIGVTCTTDGNAASRFKNNQRDWLVGVLGGASGAWAVYDITASAERARIDSSGNFLVQKTVASNTTAGISWQVNDYFAAVNTSADSGDRVVLINRQTSDGTLIEFRQANTNEGTISVSGTTVSYNGGHLSRWAQTTTAKDESLVKGTVLSNLDEMNVYTDAEGNPVDNEQLNKVKVSDVEGDANVAGVFVNWSHDEDHDVDEINMAMTGDMIIRIAQGVTVARGDLLMSAGDGTAKPQGDDIVRSKTVAKVTSTHVTCTYADGSFCVPCVLMAC